MKWGFSMDKDVIETSSKEVLAILRHLHEPEKWKNSYWLTSRFVTSQFSDGKSATHSAAFQVILDNTLQLLSQENAIYGDILRKRYWDGLSVHQMMNKAPYFWQERNFYVLQNKAVLRFTSLLLEQETHHQHSTPQWHKRALWPFSLLLFVAMAFIVIFAASPLLIFNNAQKTPITHRATNSHANLLTTAPDIVTILNKYDNAIVFDEHFENGLSEEFTNKRGFWSVISDQNKNHLLDINSMDTDIEYPVIDLGNSVWKDFLLQTRVRIVDYVDTNDAPLVSIGFRGNYKVAITPYWNSIDLIFHSPWKVISARTIEIQKNNWYRVAIYASGSDVYVFLDDTLIIHDVLNEKYSGGFDLATWPRAHIQFDDIQIRRLEK
ncbi:MAG: hypothetical protein Fur0035_11750 [Anaerolineales bacterium]